MSRLRAWRDVAEEWPAEPLAWMGAGNTRYDLGALEAAAVDLEHALQIPPGSRPVRLKLALRLAAACEPRPNRDYVR
ncbi:MAG: hypothetical protein LC637_11370 [Xanthomonadaceae bacterium]|nr:hypothetical protein [Xanthomonadaceae bacterium]